MTFLKKKIGNSAYTHLRLAGYLLFLPVLSVELIDFLINISLGVHLHSSLRMGLYINGIINGVVLGSYISLHTPTRLWAYRIVYTFSCLIIALLFYR